MHGMLLSLPLPYSHLSQNIPAYVLSYDVQGQVAPLTPAPVAGATIPDVPFFSQFKDITSTAWKKVGCGIASLAMIIEYYSPKSVSVNALLNEGIALGAYDKNAGWIHRGLIRLSKTYGLDGTSYDLSAKSMAKAFETFKDALEGGPVIASIHYKFDPKNPIPHLVVIDGIKDGIVYYNDPAAANGQKQISVIQFQKAWKKKLIILRPALSPGHTV
jgi:ABC-type bacteriocin/lantibiotic exporter with double-glycine peptidase domain